MEVPRGVFRQATGTGPQEVWEGGSPGGSGGNGESDKGWARCEGLRGTELLTRKEPGSGEVEGQRGKALGVR